MISVRATLGGIRQWESVKLQDLAKGYYNVVVRHLILCSWP